MSESEIERVIVVPQSDPVYSAWIWRRDSQTLTRLRPVLEQLRLIDDTCQVRDYPDNCNTHPRAGQRPCLACQLRPIRTALFGEMKESNDRPEG